MNINQILNCFFSQSRFSLMFCSVFFSCVRQKEGLVEGYYIGQCFVKCSLSHSKDGSLFYFPVIKDKSNYVEYKCNLRDSLSIKCVDVKDSTHFFKEKIYWVSPTLYSLDTNEYGYTKRRRNIGKVYPRQW